MRHNECFNVAQLRPFPGVYGLPSPGLLESDLEACAILRRHEVATGWSTDLFPCLDDSPGRRRNHVLHYAGQDWALPAENRLETKNSIFEPLSRPSLSTHLSIPR